MSILSIISIVMFSLSGLLLIAFAVYFITADVPASIRYLRSKGTPVGNSGISSGTVNIEASKITHSAAQNDNSQSPASSGGIEYAQQTVDTDDLDEADNIRQFETQDWELPDGVSFVLTKNIVVCHTDKEYIRHEGQ